MCYIKEDFVWIFWGFFAFIEMGQQRKKRGKLLAREDTQEATLAEIQTQVLPIALWDMGYLLS